MDWCLCVEGAVVQLLTAVAWSALRLCGEHSRLTRRFQLLGGG